jgi:hypothetical protein
VRASDDWKKFLVGMVMDCNKPTASHLQGKKL